MSTTHEIEPGRPLDLSREVVGFDRSDRRARLVEQRSGRPPQRIDGFTVGAPMLTEDAPHAGEVHPTVTNCCTWSRGITVRLELPEGDRSVVAAGEALVVPKGTGISSPCENPEDSSTSRPGRTAITGRSADRRAPLRAAREHWVVRGYGPNVTIERAEAHLRTYLGTAPGVGKTYAMLNEGRRAAGEGRDVVAGWLERHGRTETRASGRPRDHPAANGRSSGPFLRGARRRCRHRQRTRRRPRRRARAHERRRDPTPLGGCRRAAAGRARRHDDAERRQPALRSRLRRTHHRRGTVEYVPDEFVRSGEVVLIDLPPECCDAGSRGLVYSADVLHGAPPTTSAHRISPG